MFYLPYWVYFLNVPANPVYYPTTSHSLSFYVITLSFSGIALSLPAFPCTVVPLLVIVLYFNTPFLHFFAALWWDFSCCPVILQNPQVSASLLSSNLIYLLTSSWLLLWGFYYQSTLLPFVAIVFGVNLFSLIHFGSFKGLFILKRAGPVRRAISPRWDDFYPTFLWNLLSLFNEKVCYVAGKRLFDQVVFTINSDVKLLCRTNVLILFN